MISLLPFHRLLPIFVRSTNQHFIKITNNIKENIQRQLLRCSKFSDKQIIHHKHFHTLILVIKIVSTCYRNHRLIKQSVHETQTGIVDFKFYFYRDFRTVSELKLKFCYDCLQNNEQLTSNSNYIQMNRNPFKRFERNERNERNHVFIFKNIKTFNLFFINAGRPESAR